MVNDFFLVFVLKNVLIKERTTFFYLKVFFLSSEG